MLNLNSIMIGTAQPEVLAKFYAGVFDKPADMHEGEWSGWQVGSTYFSIGAHTDIKGSAKEPARIMLNLETSEVRQEFERIKTLDATVIKEPYSMEGMEGFLIATFADPDGNYFQLMSPWKQ